MESSFERSVGKSARAIVSEPVGKFREMWQEVPQESGLIVHDGQINVRRFTPVI